jgi:uncharacterized phage protein (TIGR01671 family)
MRKRVYKAFHPFEIGDEVIFLHGQPIKGEWIEGNNVFVDDEGKKAEILSGYIHYRIAFDVIPDTICEWTGAIDINGKKIFENDIVKVTESNNGYHKRSKICTVEYDEEHAEYDFYFLKGDVDSIEVLGTAFNKAKLRINKGG